MTEDCSEGLTELPTSEQVELVRAIEVLAKLATLITSGNLLLSQAKSPIRRIFG